eukprot:m.10718 g.10718  ORF g.10718 m.10718 type:complete len:1225 (-) comp6673_c0_seq1:164-3838(-)
MEETQVDNFPFGGLIPRTETGVQQLIASNDEFDGRGIRVAVLDTGVDPGALHLQTTTIGGPKIIDAVDATGSGDVDMSTSSKVTDDGTVVGLSGAVLKIPSEWGLSSGAEVRLGLKAAYELFPSPLVKRLKAKTAKDFTKVYQKILSTEEQALNAINKEEKKDEYKEQEARVAALNAFKGSFSDCGPVYDCIAFNNGSEWVGAVDTSLTGDLSDSKLMADYMVRQEYSTFSDEDQLNFSFKFYRDGAILSIVNVCGSHGTHVAGIVGAHNEENADRHGLAPGCEIVSVKIGDGRVDQMETGVGLVRAMRVAVERGCHLINLSFGEAATLGNAGHVVKEMQRIVDTFGVIFVSSAGNNGPALTTVGAPAGLSNSIISVGAYVSQSLMEASYGLANKVPDTQFTWSSRGPAPDGELGVAFSAPGGAVTDVPTYNLKGIQLMNGTSMSSPNSCGSIAVLLSALKSMGIQWTPFSIRKAVENTAQLLSGNTKLDSGHGVMRVDKALELLSKYHDMETCIPRYNVKALYFSMSKRGIYLRDEGHFVENTVQSVVVVTPTFHEDYDRRKLVEFESSLSLMATQPWIKCPPFLMLTNSSHSFNVDITTASLAPGAHFGEILAFTAGAMESGPVFRVPVTVCKPEAQQDASHLWEKKSVVFDAGHIERYFLTPPKGVCGCRITVKGSGSFVASRRFVVHTVQMKDKEAYNANEFKKYINVTPTSNETFEFPLTSSSSTFELCLAQWWASAGSCAVDVSVEYLFLDVSGDFTFRGINRMDVRCSFGNYKLKPKVSYTHVDRPLTPVAAGEVKITKDQRNVLLDDTSPFVMELKYSFKLADKAEVFPVVLNVSDLLYENEFENQLWAIFDGNKKVFGFGDAFPHRHKVTLDKGSYTLIYQFRHRSKDVLSGMKEQTVFLREKLKAAISSPVLDNNPRTGSGANFGAKLLLAGRTIPMFMNVPKIPNNGIQNGCVLRGTFSLLDGESKLATYPVEFVVSKTKAAAAKTEGNGKKKTKSLEDFVKEAELKYVATLKKDNLDEMKSFEEKYSDDISAGTTIVEKHLSLLDTKDRVECLDLINSLLEQVDVNAIATFNGQKQVESDEDTEEVKKERENMKERKKEFEALLLVKCQTLVEVCEVEASDDDGLVEQLKASFSEARKWIDLEKADKWKGLLPRYHFICGKFGLAMKALQKVESKEQLQLRNKVMDALGWKELYQQQQHLVLFPKTFPLFCE